MWFVYCVWSWVVVSTFAVAFSRGGLAALNYGLPCVLFALIIHGAIYFYLNRKTGFTLKPDLTQPSDQIYEQVADELERDYVHSGLMTRAIAEGGGDSHKTQAIYVNLRAMALMKQHKQSETSTADQSNHFPHAFHQPPIDVDIQPSESVTDNEEDDWQPARFLVGIALVLVFGVCVFAVLFK